MRRKKRVTRPITCRGSFEPGRLRTLAGSMHHGSSAPTSSNYVRNEASASILPRRQQKAMISPLMPGPWCVAATEDRMRRDAGWHQKGGRWARSLGHRGVRVRLFQKRKDGTFYRDVWIPGSGVD